MEQQCKEAEEATKINRRQEVYNKVKLFGGNAISMLCQSKMQMKNTSR